jgi:hypothetical protein
MPENDPANSRFLKKPLVICIPIGVTIVVLLLVGAAFLFSESGQARIHDLPEGFVIEACANVYRPGYSTIADVRWDEPGTFGGVCPICRASWCGNLPWLPIFPKNGYKSWR